MTRYDVFLSSPHNAFIEAIREAFEESGNFVADYDWDEVILTTRSGTQIILTAYAVLPPKED